MPDDSVFLPWMVCDLEKVSTTPKKRVAVKICDFETIREFFSVLPVNVFDGKVGMV